jgi:hypothetical protein
MLLTGRRGAWGDRDAFLPARRGAGDRAPRDERLITLPRADSRTHLANWQTEGVDAGELTCYYSNSCSPSPKIFTIHGTPPRWKR